MKTQEWRFKDKSNYEYKHGPWMTEPDKIQWQDETTGLPCLIVRNDLGALCGYVGVSKDHPFYAKDYNDCYIDSENERQYLQCHGGLTFSDGCQPDGKICHVVDSEEDDEVWWLGFDCAHYMDFVPGMTKLWTEGVYRNVEYVKIEVEDLAKQLKNINETNT